MIFTHIRDKEIFGYHNKSYNYFRKGKYSIETLSQEYNWVKFVNDGNLSQLAPTNLWRW